MTTNKQSKGKPITTSVPTFAIRFHANGEELEDIYPSEEEEKSVSEDKTTEKNDKPETSEQPTKQESSPMRDYLNKFGKRSSSIDAGISETTQNDPWRIFSEFKGKLTKTVEEKLSEIKSKNSDVESSPKWSDKHKASSKDNSSISDSEEPSISECSLPKSVLPEDADLSSDDEPSAENDRTPTALRAPLTPELRHRRKPKMQITYKKDEDKIELTKLSPETNDNKIEDEIESGVEVTEESSKLDSVFNSPSVEFAPKSFIDFRPRAELDKQNIPYKYLILIFFFLIVFLFFIFPIFMLGLFSGFVISLISILYYYLSKQNLKENRICDFHQNYNKNEEHVPILEIPAVKEHQPITKFEGWMNEYPEVYNPYTYRIVMTQPVYLKLENNILRISHTTAKIPKRAMWNEAKHNATFIHHRVYNLKGAEIVLLPKGLIHKRIWSKKYPICVILNKEFMHLDLPKKKDESVLEDLSKISNVDRSRKNSEKSENEQNSLQKEDLDDEDDKTEVDDYKEIFEKDDDRSLTEDWDTLNLDENSQDTRIYLFGRTGRDKEDWYRRLVLAARNAVPDVKSPDVKEDLSKEKDESDNSISSDINETSLKSTTESITENNSEIKDISKASCKDEEEEYLDFMAKLGHVKQDSHYSSSSKQKKKGHLFFRRKKEKHEKHEDELDSNKQDKDKTKEEKIEKEHTDHVEWLNIFIARVMFDMNKNPSVIANMQERIQKKLSTIKLPYFIEEITISQLNLGSGYPQITKIYSPTLDERGLWIDMEMTYVGLVRMSLVTKLNLIKLKEQAGRSETPDRSLSPNPEDNRSAMFYSDVEDSAESSSDDEYYVPINSDVPQEGSPRDAKSKKFLRMIDNIAASSLFQQAAENKYIKRAMEGVSKTEIKLTVDLLCLDGTLTINITAPPSDRIWIGFRDNPKLILSAKPAFGERSINLTHITKWIEKKLSLEFQKFLVLPNMEDFICPLMIPDLPK